MNNRHYKSSNNKRKKKARLRCCCVVSLLGVTLCCVALLGNTIFAEHKADAPSAISDISAESGSRNEVEAAIAYQPEPVNTSAWELLLVNPQNKLPDNFFVELTSLKNGHAIDKRAYPDLQAMMDDARAAGLSPVICSSYRTQEKQQSLFDNQARGYAAQGYSQEEAAAEAAKWVAIPGTSEHQTGLAVDIVALSYQILDEQQETTAEQKWLMANSYKYGFILRYPTDKSEITGIGYEPWHYRYVGKKAAQEIYEQGVCLEEYLAE